MNAQMQNTAPTMDIFNFPHIPLNNSDTLGDLMRLAITVGIPDPQTGFVMHRAMTPLKNPCGANYICVYFAQYDEHGNSIPTEFLDETLPFTVAASIHSPFGEVIATLPACHNISNVAEQQYVLSEIRRAYNSLPFILKHK